LIVYIVKPCNIIQINDNCVTNPFYHGKWEFKNICPQRNVEDGTVVTSPGSQKYISGHPPFNICQTCKERKKTNNVKN
jgi:hypothetical protein